MKKLLLIILTVATLGCKKDTVDVVSISSCDFDSTVSIEDEMPLPVYAFTVEYDDCSESVALFRENQNYTGTATLFLIGDGGEVQIDFINSRASTDLGDQRFAFVQNQILLGNGVIEDGMAYLTSYAPAGSDFFYRAFDDNGWFSSYASEDLVLCEGINRTTQNKPELIEPLLDNDSGWGDDIELSYIFDSDTGQYEACVSGIAGEYTIEWNINDNIYFGDSLEVVVGKPDGIYFVAATIYHQGQNVTISHNVVKGFTNTSKTGVKRARIRRPTGGG